MTKLVIIDYHSGNLRSAAKAFERAACEQNIKTNVIVSADPKHIHTADRIVLPGVGAFADCHTGLHKIDGLAEALIESITKRAVPFFGICVGMQLMATRGLEKQVCDGFNWIPGDVEKIQPTDSALKIPHMGWNTLDIQHHHPLLNGIRSGADGQHAYFVHSYHLRPGNFDYVLATTDYGGSITAIVGHGTLFGTQFHPEKSQELGLKIIGNFLCWRP